MTDNAHQKYKRLARATIYAIIAISIGCGFLIPRLEFNYNFEDFFPSDSPDLQFYDDFSKTFEPDNDFVLIAVENEAGIFEQDFLNDIRSFTDSLQQLPYVELVSSPTNFNNIIVGPFGPIEVPYVHVEKPELYAKDSVRIYSSERLVGTLFAPDGKSVCLVMQTESFLSKEKCDVLSAALKDLIKQYDFDETHVAGRIEGQTYFIEKMQFEMVVFISASMVLLVIFLFFSFRSFWGIWVPITVVLLSAVWLLALMSALGRSIDIMTTLLPTILFVVGMSDVVHILSRYLEELRAGNDKLSSLKVTFKQIGIATFLTSLTTGAGFLTLLMSSIGPIRQFGVFTAVGVILAFILAFSLLPAILWLSPAPRIATKGNDQLFWHRRLHRTFLWVLKNRKWVLVGATLIIVGSLAEISTIKVNNYILEDLSEDDPHKQDFYFFERSFSGVRPFEMAVSAKDTNSSLLEYEVLLELDKMETYLRDTYKVGALGSPLSMVKSIHQATHGGHEHEYRMPETEEEFNRMKRHIKLFSRMPAFRTMLAENKWEGRVSGKVEDLGGYIIKRKNQDLMAHFESTINQDLVEYRLTGMPLLIDKNNEDLARNMMLGLLLAFGLVALIMGVLYRSFSIVVITLIPNVLPLLIVGGVMGMLGIDLKVSTSIIFTIAFGIAVDDTIHYMSKLKLELNKGRRLAYAVKRTSISTGKAIAVTTVILCSGFMTLLLSTFTTTYYIGLLISITLFMAVLSDLILLPVLLLLFYKKK